MEVNCNELAWRALRELKNRPSAVAEAKAKQEAKPVDPEEYHHNLEICQITVNKTEKFVPDRAGSMGYHCIYGF